MPTRPTGRPARPAARRPVRRPVAQERVRRPRPKITGRMIVVLILAFVLAVSFASSLKAYLRQRADVDALIAHNAQVKASNEQKQIEIRRFNDPNYVKIRAREDLGYVMPGEIAYTALDSKGNKIDPQVTLDNQKNVGVQQTPTAWWTTVQGSIYAAGHPTAKTPPATLNR